MLESLTIKNIAVIDHAEIPFKPGLNILSGETGAGKSIVLEAISLLLGGRASADLVRNGADEAVVQGLFNIEDIPWLKPRLERLGFSPDTPELIIKRTVHRSGRHRIHVNGEPATVAMLQELCDGLIDLCGQHEHQSLLKTSTQLELIDRYGGLTDTCRTVGSLFKDVRALERERAELQQSEGERAKKADFLSFQIEELRAARLEPGEDEKLAREKLLLQSAEARAKLADGVRETLEAEGHGAIAPLQAALGKLKQLSALDEAVKPQLEGMERALAEAEEVSISINRYLSATELDPSELLGIQERLSLLADLRRKYGATVTEMLATAERLEAEFSGLGQVGQRLGQLSSELSEVQEKLRHEGTKLSQARRKVADLLATSVTAELKDLKMDEARFGIECEAREELDLWTQTGADQVQFQVQTNRGEPARPLGKIASGGELSRLMLAVRRVISDKGGIGVYLFDEIDAGIGGQTAFQVGKKLKSVAAYNQVICITHLPQVASFADHHLVVRKSSSGKRTSTQILELARKERKEELARMLGGPQLTRKSLENAAELMELAR